MSHVNEIDAKILDNILTDGVLSAVAKDEDKTTFADYQWMCRVQEMEEDELFRECIRIFESIENSQEKDKVDALNYVCRMYDKYTGGEVRFEASYVSIGRDGEKSGCRNACNYNIGSCLHDFIRAVENNYIYEFKLVAARGPVVYLKEFDKPVMHPINNSLKWKLSYEYEDGEKRDMFISADTKMEAMRIAEYRINAFVHPRVVRSEMNLISNEEFVSDVEIDTDVCIWSDYYAEDGEYLKSRTTCGCQVQLLKGMMRCYKCGRRISHIRRGESELKR